MKSSIWILDSCKQRVVAVLAFAESLFQKAGASAEKERERNDIEADS